MASGAAGLTSRGGPYLGPVRFLRKKLAWSRLALHPAWLLVGAVVLTQLLGDTRYPFSNFPMYSRLDDEATLIYLADPAGRPLSTYHHLHLSAAKVNKIYHTHLREICRRERVRITQAPPEVTQQAAAATLRTLRRINVERATEPLPPTVRIVQIRIELRDGRLQQRSLTAGEG